MRLLACGVLARAAAAAAPHTPSLPQLGCSVPGTGAVAAPACCPAMSRSPSPPRRPAPSSLNMDAAAPAATAQHAAAGPARTPQRPGSQQAAAAAPPPAARPGGALGSPGLGALDPDLAYLHISDDQERQEKEYLQQVGAAGACSARAAGARCGWFLPGGAVRACCPARCASPACWRNLPACWRDLPVCTRARVPRRTASTWRRWRRRTRGCRSRTGRCRSSCRCGRARGTVPLP